MRKIGFFRLTIQIIMVMLVTGITTVASDRLLEVTSKATSEKTSPNLISQKGFTSSVNILTGKGRDSSKPWKLPSRALGVQATENIHVLVMRYNFQFETEDDPNTTGRGWMNLGQHPIPDTSNNTTQADSIAYLDSVGHFIDPPPHDSVYFDAHMKALNRYYTVVSEGKLNLTWDIYPPVRDSVYQLPHEMAHYGRCDSVIVGLEYFFEDCIHLADSAHIIDPNHPDIDFSQYDAFILFHAGSDRQNDIGFPETCSDLFTGFIRFGRPIAVDDGADTIATALMVPETSSQDNRATALNAVLAHEFGHHLGLVDLYNTNTFMSQLGDFALMDNNGFGTGIEFDPAWTVGNSFGVIPLFPMAWSRAFLGFVDVYDFRMGTNIGIVAAEMGSNDSIKIARIPISEKQYYLIENRLADIDNIVTNVGADHATNVIQGPGYKVAGEDSITYTREYDHLMPSTDDIAGSGLAIWLIDEEVAEWDYDNDGLINFLDNQLQWDKDRRFISLVEADGLVNFGGNYRSGFGKPEDLFRDDRANSFSPLTNPPAIDNRGNDTRIFISGITRDTVTPSGATQPIFIDTLIKFDLTMDKRAGVFPIRAGLPTLGLSPIADDLNADGIMEILIPSGRNLLCVTSQGESYLALLTGCDTCNLFTDTLYHPIGINNRTEPLHIYAQLPNQITASPVTGYLPWFTLDRQVVVGYKTNDSTSGRVAVLVSNPANVAHPVQVFSMITNGVPRVLSFTPDSTLWALSSTGYVYQLSDLFSLNSPTVYQIYDSLLYGAVTIGNSWAVLSGDDDFTYLNLITDSVYFDSVYTFEISGNYEFGPVLADLNRDGIPEVIAFTADGDAIMLSVDLESSSPDGLITVYLDVSTDRLITTNPVIGDIDGDNQPDIIVGGENSVLSFDRNLTMTNEYPVQVSSLFPNDIPVAAPVVADIDSDGLTDILFPSLAGSMHAKGPDERTGFPVSDMTYNFALDQVTVGSPVLFSDTTGGMVGYLSADGWFYAYEIDLDTSVNYWPMAGGNPSGSFSFDVPSLGIPSPQFSKFESENFYVYPNPVTTGRATIRYFLGEQANAVVLNLFDLTGNKVAQLTGPTNGEVFNEVSWDCSNVIPGVYRCLIDVTFTDGSTDDFIDIAVIR